MTRNEWMQALIAAHRPGRCLALRFQGPLPGLELQAPDATVEWLANAGTLAALSSAGRYDLAILVDQLEFMAPIDRRHLLVRLRDLHAPRVAVCVTEAAANQWTPSEWRALQLEPGEMLEEPGARYVTYRFDLATYNPERSWNTPEHWANPANFDRYRW
jgi:hypothetical protein